MVWWLIKRAIACAIMSAVVIAFAKYLVSVGGGDPSYTFAPYLLAASQPDGIALIVVACAVISILMGLKSLKK